jgi:hypothetical protein
MQRPLQAMSQQTPSTHWLLVHSAARAQVAPLAFLVVQVMPLQYAEETHSASPPQVVRQAVPPHRCGLHIEVGTVRQVPIPSQVRSGVDTPLLHWAGAQGVPALCTLQAPLPSQKPSPPQPLPGAH